MSDPLDELPAGLIQYGCHLVCDDGQVLTSPLRWRECWDAVQYGQSCIDDPQQRAVECRIFREAAF